MIQKKRIIHSIIVTGLALLILYVVWAFAGSPTKVAFLNYQVITMGRISAANDNSSIRLYELTPEDAYKAGRYDILLINGMGLVIIPVFVVGGLIGHVKAKIRAGRIQHGKACAAVIHIGYAQIRFVKQLAGYIQHPAGIEGHGLTVKIHQLLIGGSKIYAFQHRPAFFRHQHRYQGQSQQPCPDSAGQSFPHSQPPPFFSPSGMIVHFSTKDSAAQRKLHSQPQRLSLFLFQYGMI